MSHRLYSHIVQTPLNAAEKGAGASFLSLDHVPAYNSPNLATLNIDDFRAERLVNVCYHKDKIFTPLMKGFLECYPAGTQEILQNNLQLYLAGSAGASFPAGLTTIGRSVSKEEPQYPF